MALDAGDIAGVIAGYKMGKLTEREVRRFLRENGTGEDVIDSLLSTAAGVGVGLLTGSIVNDLVDDIFGDL